MGVANFPKSPAFWRTHMSPARCTKMNIWQNVNLHTLQGVASRGDIPGQRGSQLPRYPCQTCTSSRGPRCLHAYHPTTTQLLRMQKCAGMGQAETQSHAGGNVAALHTSAGNLNADRFATNTAGSLCWLTAGALVNPSANAMGWAGWCHIALLPCEE